MKITNDLEMLHTHWKEVVSDDKYRPAMTGVYFDLINGVMVATNSHLLLESPITIDFDEEETKLPVSVKENILKSYSKIVPVEFFDKRKYMGDIKDYAFDVHYDLSDKNYARVFNGPEEVFKCKYIDAKFPNYKAVYPQGQIGIDSIGVNLSTAMRIYKAMPFSNQKKDIHFKFYAKNRGIVFQCNYEKKFKGIIMPVMEMG